MKGDDNGKDKKGRVAAKEAAKATTDEVSCHQDSGERDTLEDDINFWKPSKTFS